MKFYINHNIILELGLLPNLKSKSNQNTKKNAKVKYLFHNHLFNYIYRLET
jgi:hypothetical protein